MFVVSAGGRVDTQADQHGIMGAVVSAFDLGELAASGEGPRRPQGVQRRLGARVGETDLLERWDAFAQQPGQIHLVAVGRIVGQTMRHLVASSVQHRRRAVAQYHGGHRVDEVQAFDAISIRHHRTLSGLGEDGIWVPKYGVPAFSSGKYRHASSQIARDLGVVSR